MRVWLEGFILENIQWNSHEQRETRYTLSPVLIKKRISFSLSFVKFRHSSLLHSVLMKYKHSDSLKLSWPISNIIQSNPRFLYQGMNYLKKKQKKNASSYLAFHFITGCHGANPHRFVLLGCPSCWILRWVYWRKHLYHDRHFMVRDPSDVRAVANVGC